MKILLCPHCDHKVTNLSSLVDFTYLINNDKECQHCSQPVELNVVAYFLFYFGIGFYTIAISLAYFKLFQKKCLSIASIFFSSNEIAPICDYLLIPILVLSIVLYFFIITHILKLRMFRGEEKVNGT